MSSNKGARVLLSTARVRFHQYDKFEFVDRAKTAGVAKLVHSTAAMVSAQSDASARQASP
jgi:hypothetical protein